MKVWITEYGKDVCGDPQAFSTPEKALDYLVWFIQEYTCSAQDKTIALAQERFNQDKSVFGINDLLYMVEVEIDNF